MPPVGLTDWDLNIKLTQLGAIAAFLFLMAGASRLARFNITFEPTAFESGRPGKKYFVGMPIPAGAGVVAAVVHFQVWRPSGFLVQGDPVAGNGGGSGLPDGEHMALL